MNCCREPEKDGCMHFPHSITNLPRGLALAKTCYICRYSRVPMTLIDVKCGSKTVHSEVLCCESKVLDLSPHHDLRMALSLAFALQSDGLEYLVVKTPC